MYIYRRIVRVSVVHRDIGRLTGFLLNKLKKGQMRGNPGLMLKTRLWADSGRISLASPQCATIQNRRSYEEIFYFFWYIVGAFWM